MPLCMKKRAWVAGKPKKKPDYDSGQIKEEVECCSCGISTSGGEASIFTDHCRCTLKTGDKGAEYAESP